ncbi:acetolactate synthase small subunit [Natranaerovirga pectinivora]|uniref:Acetolactate synthase small subunit n=1 Tax=Natranaerovirga pectinivora TaxID=682400 RepID=A0A4R3MME1_9FIRM|nr:acetolactate synthase small subunit [Natranaerovirga pectinivora]TCT16113.1 acetolactate synthase small subunit [Natranaerovirga pectinivora]
MNNYVVIGLLVKNHPGVMSHITGLFARRSFNVEGILCGRVEENEKKSHIYLLVKNDDFLEQIVKQLNKLYDVDEVKVYEDADYQIFKNLNRFFE